MLIHYFCTSKHVCTFNPNSTMKILTAAQFKIIDNYTIEHEPVSSIDLMERASRAMADKICARWTVDTPIK